MLGCMCEDLRCWTLVILLMGGLFVSGFAQVDLETVDLETVDLETDADFVVGIKEAAPFSFKNDAGVWDGISVTLWEQIAADTGVSYRYEERDLRGIIDGVTDGTLDAAIGALTITPTRETIFDFSHAFYNTGLGVAVRKGGSKGILDTLRQIMSGSFFRVVGLILVGLLIMTVLITLFERNLVKREPGKDGKARNKLAESLWWALVIMIGKNDSHPVSFGGRVMALSWMAASLFILSSLTAVITSVLTVNELQSNLTDPSQLSQVRVATVASSSSEDYLTEERVNYETAASVEEALGLLNEGAVDAVVYDKPLLLYWINNDYETLDVLPFTLAPQSYGIAVTTDNAWLELINQSLLTYNQGEAWNSLLFRYFGE